MSSSVGQQTHSSRGNRLERSQQSHSNSYDEYEPSQPGHRGSVDECGVDISNSKGKGRLRSKENNRLEANQVSQKFRNTMRDSAPTNTQSGNAYRGKSVASQTQAGEHSSNKTKRSPYRYEREDRAHRIREGAKMTTPMLGRFQADTNSSTSRRTSSRNHSTSLPPRAPTPPPATRPSNTYSQSRSSTFRDEFSTRPQRTSPPRPPSLDRGEPSFTSTTNAIPSRSERLRSRAKVRKDGTWKLGAFAAIALTAYIVFEKRRKRKHRLAQTGRNGIDRDIEFDDEEDFWAFDTHNLDVLDDPLPRTRSPRPYSGRVPEDDDPASLGVLRHSASHASFDDDLLVLTPPPKLKRYPYLESCGAGPSWWQSPTVDPAASKEPQIGLGALVKHPDPSSTAKVASCIVCDSSVDSLKRRSPTSRCNASCVVCKTCMSQWLETQIRSGDWQNTRCPNCSNTLTSTDIKHFTSKKTYARYSTLANRAHFSAIPSFRWCLSPTCSSGQIHNGGTDAPIFRCIECGHKSCIVHNRAWHEGETCKQFDERTDGRKRLKDEQASMRVVGQTTKICPGKDCGWRITKFSGCDHMTCSQCKHEFCWLCMADYKKIRTTGNSIHMDNCPHHTNNLR